MEGENKAVYLKQLEATVFEVVRKFKAELHRGVAFKLTPSQYLLLKKLSCGRATISSLAGFLGVSLSAVTSLANRLCEAGYVSRIRCDEDRRLVWLEITPEGKKELEECMNGHREVLKRFLGCLSGEDLIELNRILKVINEKTNLGEGVNCPEGGQ